MEPLRCQHERLQCRSMVRDLHRIGISGRSLLHLAVYKSYVYGIWRARYWLERRQNGDLHIVSQLKPPIQKMP